MVCAIMDVSEAGMEKCVKKVCKQIICTSVVITCITLEWQYDTYYNNVVHLQEFKFFFQKQDNNIV